MTSTSSLLAIRTPTQNERIAAAIAHGGTCLAWFLAPLIVYALEKNRSEYVSRHALQALVWSAAGTLVSLATCGLAIPLFLCVHLYAAYQAYEGRTFEYPLIGGIVDAIG